MKTNISEDLPARKFSPAAAGGAAGGESGSSGADGPGGDIEKKARQLVYDAKYEVRKMMGKDTRMDPAAVTRAVMQRIDKSSSSQPVKMRARKIVMGDGQKKDVKEFASQNVAKALFDVFVNHPTNVIDEEELKKDLEEAIDTQGEKKYKVRVTDKKTGNSYIRWATRPKITELRGNPNIESVEMLDLYGSPEPNESERSKGAQTASTTAGKGLANKDYDGDGKVESGAKEYRGAVHNAIQRKKGGIPNGKDTSSVKEEFIGEGDYDGGDKQLKPMPKGKKNKCKVYDGKGRDNNMMGQGLMNHQELEGEVIAEKAVSKAQQRFMGMVYATKKGEKPASPEVAAAAKSMSGKEAKKFASTKHKGLPDEVKEENESGCGDKKKKEMDSREIPTKVNLVKNKLRAMGLKMSYELEGEKIDEVLGGQSGDGYIGHPRLGITNPLSPPKKQSSAPKTAPKNTGLAGRLGNRASEMDRIMNQMNSYELEGEVIDEIGKSTEMSLEDYVMVGKDGKREVKPGNPPKAKLKKKTPNRTPEEEADFRKNQRERLSRQSREQQAYTRGT